MTTTLARPARPDKAPWLEPPSLPRPLPQAAAARHVLGMEDVPDLHAVLDTAVALKRRARSGLLPPLLAGRSVVVLFQKPSTRTRVSLELGIQRLGGAVSSLDAGASQLGRGESLEDTAAVLARYADAIVVRANRHADLMELARHSAVPVVNALTDEEHPLQVLADWMALGERWGSLAGRVVAYVGDGNNMCHSYLLGAPLAGMEVRVATPPGYAPDARIVQRARALARRAGTTVHVGHDPRAAARGADAVATDTWVSMGDDGERDERLRAFAGFTVDAALMEQAAPGAWFLHCLPGHWGEEATHDVAHGPQSLILDQAENRLWAQMALLARLLRPGPLVPREP